MKIRIIYIMVIAMLFISLTGCNQSDETAKDNVSSLDTSSIMAVYPDPNIPENRGFAFQYEDEESILLDYEHGIKVNLPIDKGLIYDFSYFERSSVEGDAFLGRTHTIYYPFKGDDPKRNRILISGWPSSTGYLDGLEGEEYDLKVEGIAYSRYKVQENEDGIYLLYEPKYCMFSLEAYFSKEAYAQAEDMLIDIMKSMKEFYVDDPELKAYMAARKKRTSGERGVEFYEIKEQPTNFFVGCSLFSFDFYFSIYYSYISNKTLQ